MRYCLSIFYLLLATWLPAQQHDAATGCTDIVYLKGGSVYRGKILENPDNGPLVIQTWSGLTLHLPAAKIRRIVQHCPDAPKGGKSSFAPQPYTFRERGWYNATGMSVLAGRSWWNENVTGFSLYNSTGYLFSRWLGVGIGLGVDAYSPWIPMPISISPSPMVKVGRPAAGTVQGESATPMEAMLARAL